jgi:hypothetical protein
VLLIPVMAEFHFILFILLLIERFSAKRKWFHLNKILENNKKARLNTHFKPHQGLAPY